MFLRGAFGIPVPQLAIALLALLVKAEKTYDLGDAASLTVRQKIVKLFNHEITFIMFGLLVLICFISAFIISTATYDNTSAIALISAHSIGYLKQPFTAWHVTFMMLGVLTLLTSIGLLATSVEEITPSDASGALKFLGFAAVSMLFHIACLGCGYWASLFILGILVFLCMISIIAISVPIYKSDKGDYAHVGAASTEKAALRIMINVSSPSLIGFLLSSYYFILLELPYTKCEILLLLLVATAISCLITVIADNIGPYGVQSEKVYPLITVNFVLTILVLLLLYYYHPFPKYYTPYEIAFVFLDIVVLLCFVLIIVFASGDTLEYNNDHCILASVFFILLLIPFFYCAYRIRIHDFVIAFFKGSHAVDKVNSNNLVGDVSGSAQKVFKTVS
ncbi:uncharacterized protein BXIN_2890 [Babesia sp. Xinjiang]|uniref:uncharacterized protein n=1 Tax=Babesia sp. Xinjiang TaxID=462227 RepID=UPI000A259D41|nr:uncharacterized protein BXIN_2890 [Babesia sp. Xinjiang]ORM39496.1 hypothetical protein BXIN_2890 [Babesia sp. Xinjiang]